MFDRSIPKAINPRFNALPDVFVLGTSNSWRAVDAASGDVLIFGRCRVRELNNADFVRLLFRQKVPFQGLGMFGWGMQPCLDNVFIALCDLAWHSEVGDGQFGFVDASVV